MINKLYKKPPLSQVKELQDFRAAHKLKKLATNNLRWEYISTGKGKKTIVLLPGSIRFAEIWFKLIKILEKEFKVISPNYPEIKTIKEALDGISKILLKEEQKNIILIGSSFGGWVAQCFVRKYPHLVKKLLLSNTYLPESRHLGLYKYINITFPLYPTPLLKRMLRNNYFKIFTVSAHDKDFWKAFITENLYYNTNRKEILNQYKCIYDYFKNYSFSSNDLGKWDGKILIIESIDDIVSKDKRENLKRVYPMAELVSLENAGHTPGYTQPEKFYSIIKDFLYG